MFKLSMDNENIEQKILSKNYNIIRKNVNTKCKYKY